GPVFANIVLVDELNRATPRTQSALLECMAEGQVSADGQTYALDRPFLVFATQNPFDFEGTFPLPEAQLDRFAMRMRIGYPTEADEVALLERQRKGDPLDSISPVVDVGGLLNAQAAVRDVFVHEEVRRYLTRLVRATRAHADVQVGASPRATLALFRLGQASAAMAGADFVAPETVRALAPRVLEHRLSLKPDARMRGIRAETIVQEILDRTAAPGGR
ncbi:MoxR family ATPase, partial [bacterium]